MSRHPYLLPFVVVLHLVWAACLLAFPSSAQTTGLNTVAEVAGGRVPAALLLILTSLLVLYALRSRKRSVFWFLPQQALLVIAATGVTRAIVDGRFADGVPRPRPFILTDKLTILLMCLFHTLVIIDYARRHPVSR